MLEATLLLELVLGKYTQAVIIAVLLVLNAVLSFLQERRASNALQLLRQHLTVQARVLRDGRWQLVLAQDLVPGDVVHVRMGDLAPADVLLRDGQILVDQSALTGESAPVEVGPGNTAFAGSTVRRGEATGEVAATGRHTRFGKTAELVRTSRTPSHLEALIFTVVKYLVALDVLLVVAILVYAVVGGIPLVEIIPFALILLVASVPVALPATYTLASALGSLELARRGVLVTRLSAVEEAAAMDVLCSDKTGTITKNQLAVAALRPTPLTRKTNCSNWRLSPVTRPRKTPSTWPFSTPPGGGTLRLGSDSASSFSPSTRPPSALKPWFPRPAGVFHVVKGDSLRGGRSDRWRSLSRTPTWTRWQARVIEFWLSQRDRRAVCVWRAWWPCKTRHERIPRPWFGAWAISASGS